MLTLVATGGITDLILALWPISIVWNLQTALRVKVGFCLLMAVGIVPAAAAFVRIQLLTRLHTAKDPTCKSILRATFAESAKPTR